MKPCPFAPKRSRTLPSNAGTAAQCSERPPRRPSHPVPGVRNRGAGCRAIFKGAPSWKAQFWSEVAAIALGVGGLCGAPILHCVRRCLELGADRGRWHWAGRVLAALPVGRTGHAQVPHHDAHYRRRVGLLSKNIETLQLWRVRDIEFHQTMTDRLLGVSVRYSPMT